MRAWWGGCHRPPAVLHTAVQWCCKMGHRMTASTIICVHACKCVSVCIRALSFNVLLHPRTHTHTHIVGVAPCWVPISVSRESARSSSSKAPKISLHWPCTDNKLHLITGACNPSAPSMALAGTGDRYSQKATRVKANFYRYSTFWQPLGVQCTAHKRPRLRLVGWPLLSKRGYKHVRFVVLLPWIIRANSRHSTHFSSWHSVLQIPCFTVEHLRCDLDQKWKLADIHVSITALYRKQHWLQHVLTTTEDINGLPRTSSNLLQNRGK